jgi:hypothetical protein
MRKLPAALGIILLLTSFVMMIGSNISYGGYYFEWEGTDPNPVEVGAAWNISHAFEQGDWFKLEVAASQDWADHLQPSDAAVPVPYQPVFVNITSPTGGETEVYCDYAQISAKAALILYNITVTEANGLTSVHFDPPLYGVKPGIVARTLSSGNYTARITAIAGGGSAPFTMRMTKGAVLHEYVTYSYLLYPSIVVLIVSVVLMVYGFRKSKPAAHRRTAVAGQKNSK